jgi:hypothetical protein
MSDSLAIAFPWEKTITGIGNGQSPKLYPEGVAHSGNKMTKSGEQNKYLTGSFDEVLNLYAHTNFLNACYRYFSCSPFSKQGWGGRSVASQKEIGIRHPVT